MSTDFLKTNSPEIWTKEVYRNQQFMRIEENMIEAEVSGNYELLLKLARIYLRFQMEVMEEKVETKDKEGNPVKDEAGRVKRETFYGLETPLFMSINRQITELETKWRNISSRKIDPLQRVNDNSERNETISQIENLLAVLFHNNTALGLNYKKKNDPMKAAYY